MPDTASKMPARISCDDIDAALCAMPSQRKRGTAYYRADIVERLVEALEGLVQINESHNESISKIIGRPLGWKDEYLNASRSALASYRESINDKT